MRHDAAPLIILPILAHSPPPVMQEFLQSLPRYVTYNLLGEPKAAAEAMRADANRANECRNIAARATDLADRTFAVADSLAERLSAATAVVSPKREAKRRHRSGEAREDRCHPHCPPPIRRGRGYYED